MATNPDLVVIYARVSTDAERQELGMEAQVADCERWCKVHGKTIVGLYREELSGATKLEDRHEMLAAIEHLKSNKAGILLAQKIDRFSRDMHEATKIVHLVRRAGATIMAVQSGGVSDPISELMFNILVSFGQYEREMIKDRIKRALAVKKNRGEYIGGKIPYGFRAVPKTELPGVAPHSSPEQHAPTSIVLKSKTPVGDQEKVPKILVEDEIEQQNILRLKALRGEGLSWERVANKAYAEGIRWRNGRRMDRKWISQILSSEELVKAPYGFRWDPTTKELVVVEEERNILSWIFEHRARSVSIQEMVRLLRESGMRTRSGCVPSARWVRSRISEAESILMTPNEECVTDKH